MSSSDAFESLNDAQRRAAEHGVDSGVHGPLLILAGAGSGKTLTLACRVARLIVAGADPHRLLLMTFSRRAALELERRAGRALCSALGLPSSQRVPALPWTGTFHSIGARLLRELAPRIGLSDRFTILDRADAEDLMGEVRHSLGFTASKKRFPAKGTCLALYSRTVNSDVGLREVLDAAFPWCLEWESALGRMFEAYTVEKQRQHVLDYDDLLVAWSHAMQSPDIARELRGRFDHVLVDEYQDTNRLQASILLALRPDGRGLTVVGDDAQSIYAFRAADVRNILDFPSHFTPPATVIRLERNYRSTPGILDATNALIAGSSQRHEKRLWTDAPDAGKPQLVAVADEPAQATWVADRVLEHRESGLALKRQAVLFRTSHHSAALELELARRGIPFVKFGGLKFLEAAHVKDVLAVLRLAQNPSDGRSAVRVALLVPGIGPAAARRFSDALANTPDPLAALRKFDPPTGASADWQPLSDLLQALRIDATGWPAEVERVVGWYAPHLARLHSDAAARRADLDQLARIASASTSRERFLTDLALDPPDAASDESGPPHLDDDYLILSTIHSAKGREWPSVTVLNVVDGCIPSDMATGSTEQIEEERRLLYVAATRAQRHLQLIVPRCFHVSGQAASGDRHVTAAVSRFLGPDVIARFERVAPRPTTEAPVHVAAEPAPPLIDVSARMRARWA